MHSRQHLVIGHLLTTVKGLAAQVLGACMGEMAAHCRAAASHRRQSPVQRQAGTSEQGVAARCARIDLSADGWRWGLAAHAQRMLQVAAVGHRCGQVGRLALLQTDMDSANMRMLGGNTAQIVQHCRNAPEKGLCCQDKLMLDMTDQPAHWKRRAFQVAAKMQSVPTSSLRGTKAQAACPVHAAKEGAQMPVAATNAALQTRGCTVGHHWASKVARPRQGAAKASPRAPPAAGTHVTQALTAHVAQALAPYIRLTAQVGAQQRQL